MTGESVRKYRYEIGIGIGIAIAVAIGFAGRDESSRRFGMVACLVISISDCDGDPDSDPEGGIESPRSTGQAKARGSSRGRLPIDR